MRKKRIFIMMVLFMAFSILPIQAKGSHTVEIPVVINGHETVVITTSNDAPLPQETSKRIDQSGSFSITYDEVGDYFYTVTQTPGSDPYTTYDDSVWHIQVFVYFTEDNELTSTMVISKEGEEEKYECVIFDNQTDIPPTPTPPSPTPPPPPSGKSGTWIPFTGDNTNIELMLLLFGGSIGFVLWSLFKLKLDKEID